MGYGQGNRSCGKVTEMLKGHYFSRWYYSPPKTVPNAEGDMVLIQQCSFGPIEVFEWGVDKNNRPYEQYQWLENDWYEDENYRKKITTAELLNQINRVIALFQQEHLTEWVEIYQNIAQTIIKQKLSEE